MFKDHFCAPKSVIAGTKTFKQGIPESLLILYRSGILELSPSTLKLTICQKHRDHYGIYWKRNRRTCCYPDHPASSKARPDRGATLVQCKGLWMNARQCIPVGAGKHLKRENCMIIYLIFLGAFCANYLLGLFVQLSSKFSLELICH